MQSVSDFITRTIQLATAHGVPSVHPAAKASSHVLPAIEKFLTKGEGLPGLQDLTSIAAFKRYYGGTDPLQTALTFLTGITTLTWVVSEATGNWSQVDRLWALLPVLYTAHFTFHSYFSASKELSAKLLPPTDHSIFKFLPSSVDERMFLVFALQVLWSLRLHGNTLRRGFFNFSEEDYRWPVIRNALPKSIHKPFNLFIVSIFQHIVLFVPGLLPYLLYTAHTDTHPTRYYPSLGWPDLLIAGLFVTTLVIEQTADEQQQIYQKWKHAELKKQGGNKDAASQPGGLQRGFVTTGLWAWSRHPNFLCEQTTWWILYLFSLRVTVPPAVGSSVIAGLRHAVDRRSLVGLGEVFDRVVPHLFNYSILAALSMNLIFFSSTPITEYISRKKYPLYRQYQKRVGMFLPADTLLVKVPWLTITGKRALVEADVFGKPRTAIEPARKTQ